MLCVFLCACLCVFVCMIKLFYCMGMDVQLDTPSPKRALKSKDVKRYKIEPPDYSKRSSLDDCYAEKLVKNAKVFSICVSFNSCSDKRMEYTANLNREIIEIVGYSGHETYLKNTLNRYPRHTINITWHAKSMLDFKIDEYKIYGNIRNVNLIINE